MNFRSVRLGSVLVVAACCSLQAAAIESQAVETAKALPVQVHQVLSCGSWKQGPASGHYRIVLFDVSYGTGTEVYVQRIQEDAQPSGLALRLVETLPIRELNNDHAQYEVVSARCGGLGTHSVVDLVATFEHDERNIRHHVRITLPAPGRYGIDGVVGQRSSRR